jgi:twinkle protein
MGIFVRHIPCGNCGSSDANSLYADNTTYCHKCGAYGDSPDSGETMDATNTGRGRSTDLVRGSIQAISKRGIREETCAKFGYQVGEYKDERCHIAPYHDASGRIIAQKVRLPGKKFTWVGAPKEALPLFGQHLWRDGGKSVVITEGEIDALSVAQAFNLKWPVVSLPNGAQAAKKDLLKAFEWLNSYEKIVLCFDMDEPGLKAREEVAELLPVGKVFFMNLPHKDANEVLLKDGTAPIVSAFWDAKPWRPDGIISGADLTVERLKAASVKGYSLPWPIATERLGGIREGELTLITAGSGIGKSTAVREIAYHLHQKENLTIGNIFLEEGVEKTGQAYVAIHNNVRLKKLREDPSILTDKAWEETYNTVLKERMFFYDHFGSLDSDRLLAKMRYMRQVLGCHFVILDHISIVISGQESSSEGERKDIDRLMTKLRSLVEETGLGVIAIVHLRQPEGRPHEEGGRVTLSQLRGSGALKQLSDNVWALERDQQGNDPNQSNLRILKDREDGAVGLADTLEYTEFGRLIAVNDQSAFGDSNGF